MTKPVYKNAASRIKEYRNKAGLTQEQLAHKANIEPSFLAHIEAGQKGFSLETLEKIAKALDVSIDVFFRGQKPGQDVYDFNDKRLLWLLKESGPKDRDMIYRLASVVLNKNKQ